MNDYIKQLEDSNEELQQRLAKLEEFNAWRDRRHIQRLRFNYIVDVTWIKIPDTLCSQNFRFDKIVFGFIYKYCKESGLHGLDKCNGLFSTVTQENIVKIQFRLEVRCIWMRQFRIDPKILLTISK